MSQKTWKNGPQKLLIIGPFFSVLPKAQNQPKSQFLFHKYCSPRDLCIITLGAWNVFILFWQQWPKPILPNYRVTAKKLKINKYILAFWNVCTKIISGLWQFALFSILLNCAKTDHLNSKFCPFHWIGQKLNTIWLNTKIDACFNLLKHFIEIAKQFREKKQ